MVNLEMANTTGSTQNSAPRNAGWLTFQWVLGVLSLIPIVTGVLTLMGVQNPEYAAMGVVRNPLLDSNIRFLGGIWLGAGLTLFWLLPRIRTEVSLLWALLIMIMIGGIGRMLSMFFIGMPPAPFIGFTALEVIGMPLLLWWHSKLRASL
jgi:hypothetical protein